jgi:hypothetical protein
VDNVFSRSLLLLLEDDDGFYIGVGERQGAQLCGIVGDGLLTYIRKKDGQQHHILYEFPKIRLRFP